MSEITLDLFRFDEAKDDEPRRERVKIDFSESATVLDALEYAKAEIDGTISFRRSCRSAICGSCSMNINGVTGLACKTPISTVLREDRSVKIDPMPNFTPMRDMVVHMDPFWDKYSRLKPYLQPADRDEDHERERLVSPEDMKKLVAVANCVMCATCYALCPVVSVDPSFAGPAAISYAYRFIEDTRDAKREERVAQISDDYLWLCAHCYACSYCPKHVDPHDRIIDTKRISVEVGQTDAPGPRHALTVAKTIKQSGMLAENEVIVGTIGRFNFKGLLSVMPLGLRLASKGKIPPLIMHPVEKIAEIRTIFDAMEVPVA